ncbi:MAG: hypothetical protein V9F05_12770 [Chitinophagaceae bacterium]
MKIYTAGIYNTLDQGFILGAFFNNDFWVIKLQGNCSPSPELCNSLDDNCNGIIDDGITETISITAGGPISFCQGGSVLLTATYSGAICSMEKEWHQYSRCNKLLHIMLQQKEIILV